MTIEPISLDHRFSIRCLRTCRLLFAAFTVTATSALVATSATSAIAPSLGTAQSFAVLAASAITNAGPTVVNGDLGISPGFGSSVTGFPPGSVLGTTHYADGLALSAQSDLTIAYNALAGQACDVSISADLGGMTLVPGVYCSASSMGLTGALTLDAQGNPNAVFVFQVGSALTTASGSTVSVINGGQACNVFWQVGSSATLGTGTGFVGSVLALVSDTLDTGATINGRVFARTGAVTMSSNTVSVCSLGATSPTAAMTFAPTTMAVGGSSTLTVTLGNLNALPATLIAPLSIALPSGLTIGPTPSPTTTCGGAGVPIAASGASSAMLPAGRTIAANGTCTFSFSVAALSPGIYTTTLPTGALATTNGSSSSSSSATLTVVAATAGTPTSAIPTTSDWALMVLAGLLLVGGLTAVRQR